jgi:Lecithin retinol acyltransferase
MDRRTDNAFSVQRRSERFSSRDSLLCVGEEPALACHLVTTRTLYSHHGIYVGNGRVIHYAGLSHGLRRGPVEDVSLEYFAHGHGIRVRDDRPRFDRREVVARARSRLGESSYRILTNNCEHFCEWCLNGASRSRQVERLVSGARRFACALLGTLGLAAGTPTFADPASQHAARVEGEGPTIIVMVAGLGDTHNVWADVHPLIATNCAGTLPSLIKWRELADSARGRCAVRRQTRALKQRACNGKSPQIAVKRYPARALVAGPPDKVQLPETPSETPA